MDPDAVVTAADHQLLESAGDTGRIPGELHVTVWTSIERLLADPSFGLRLAPSIVTASSLGVVGLMAMTSSTVGESLSRSVKYSRVLKDDVFGRMHVGEREVVVELWSAEPLPRPIADASIYAFRHYCEQWSGQPLTPRAVFFRHKRPHDVHEYERFGCAVHFEHAVDAIVFDREVCTVPLVTAQPEVASYLETVADARMAELEATGRSGDLRTRVATSVREALAEGHTDVADVARRIGMSARTLQRGLAEQGVSYRKVLDEVRWAAAAPLVTATDLSLEQIAERLGYADGKAFRRAFRRWAGVAPIDVRRNRGR